jgi:hypothetical protein
MAEESGSIFEALGLKEERITRLLPLGLGAAYIVGFLIVGLQLAGYGASPLELVKLQYLAAGFWFGLVVLFYYALTALFRSFFLEKEEAESGRLPRKHRSINVLSSIVMGLAFCSFPAPTYLFQKMPRFREAVAVLSAWHHSLIPIVLTLVFVDILIQVYFLARERPVRPDKLQFWKGFFIVLAPFTAVLLLTSCVQFFARGVYPNISFSLGGGKTRQVIFWLGPSTGATESFLERDGTKSYTVPYELLVESENSLVVISPKEGQKAIQFDRKSVGAMFVLGKRTGPAHIESSAGESAPLP